MPEVTLQLSQRAAGLLHELERETGLLLPEAVIARALECLAAELVRVSEPLPLPEPRPVSPWLDVRR